MPVPRGSIARLQPRVRRQHAVRVDQHSAARQGRIAARIELSFRSRCADVMESERCRDRVSSRQRHVEEIASRRSQSTAKSSTRQSQHRLIRVDARYSRRRQNAKHACGQSACAGTEIDDASSLTVTGRKRGCGRVEDRLIVRNKGSDPRVVLAQLDPEMRRDAHQTAVNCVSLRLNSRCSSQTLTHMCTTTAAAERYQMCRI